MLEGDTLVLPPAIFELIRIFPSNDKELLVSTLKSLGVPYHDSGYEIWIGDLGGFEATKDEREQSYSGFVFIWEFDKEGKLTKYGAYE